MQDPISTTKDNLVRGLTPDRVKGLTSEVKHLIKELSSLNGRRLLKWRLKKMSNCQSLASTSVQGSDP